MNKDMQRVFEQMEQVFDTAEKAFNQMPEQPKDYFNNAKISQEHIRINFKNRRWATFYKFFRCALEILFTGQTTFVVKRR